MLLSLTGASVRQKSLTMLCGSVFAFYAAFVVIAVSTHSPAIAATPEPQHVMEYRYWNGTGGRNNYELALLKLILDHTLYNDSSIRYPPYRITEVSNQIISSRSQRELEKGERINIYTGPAFLADNKSANIITVSIPILKGLLGYRKLVVRNEDLKFFDSIRFESDLQKLRAGQGRGWHDNPIYRKNNYNLVENGEFHQLAPMLNQNRFDYIPLGIGEITNYLKDHTSPDQNLVQEPSILIYYPFPVFFHLSARFPEMAIRLEQGLKMAIEDGSFDELFQRFFDSVIAEVNSKPYTLFVLDNPDADTHLGLDKPILLDNRLYSTIETAPDISDIRDRH